MALVLDGDSGIVGVLATNADGDVIIDTNTFFVDAPNNSVGIGTLTPTRKLHVNGSARFDMAAGTVRISEQQSKVSVQATNSAESAFADLKLDGSNIIFNTQSNGNVGIGNDNPLQKLSVTGRMNVDQQSDYYGAWIDGNTAGDSWFAVGTWYTNGGRMTAGSVEGQGLHLYTHNTGHQLTLQKDGGNVGIGTNSPLDKLTVRSTDSNLHSTTLTKGTNTKGVWVINSNNDDDMMGIHMGAGGGTHFSSIVGARTANASHWGTHLGFYTHGNNTSALNTATERMRIDGDGRITKPYQPGFRAGRSGNYTPGSSVAILFNSTSGGAFYNDGGHYNSTNGRFTAPVDGKYFFHTMVIWGPGIGDNTDMTDSFRFRINGSLRTYSHRRAKYRSEYTGTSGYFVDHGTDIFKLNAGDYVEIWSQKPNQVHGNDEYTLFTGYLLG